MEWTYGVVAFLDVLGFASFVNEDAQRSDPHHLTRLLKSFEEVRNRTPIKKLDLRSFSDSITIAGELSGTGVVDVVDAVVGLQRALIRHGVLVRGGVALGKHYADESLVYSEALVRAFRLERDRARFPRVIVDDDLFDWFVNDKQTDPGIRGIATALMLRDSDDEVLLNYLDKDLLAAHKKLLDGYSRPNLSASVLEKVQWLAGYHNYVATPIDSALTFAGEILPGFRPL